jgi:hypothetical protein
MIFIAKPPKNTTNSAGKHSVEPGLLHGSAGHGSGCSGSLFRVSRIGGCTGSTGRWLTGDRIAGVLWSRRCHPPKDRAPSPSTLPITSLSQHLSISSISRFSLGLISLFLSSLSLSDSLCLTVFVREKEERRRKEERKEEKKQSWTAIHREEKREKGKEKEKEKG